MRLHDRREEMLDHEVDDGLVYIGRMSSTNMNPRVKDEWYYSRDT